MRGRWLHRREENGPAIFVLNLTLRITAISESQGYRF